MTGNELKEVLEGVNNQLDSTERRELIDFILILLTKKQREQVFEYCYTNHLTDTRISLEENGIEDD